MEELTAEELRLMFEAIGTSPAEADETDQVIMAMATSLIMTGKHELADKLLQQHRQDREERQ